MADLITTAQTEQMLEATGGVAVVYGGDSTYGHFERIPVEILREGTSVLTSEPSVVIATDSLSGITVDSGIDEEITVDSDPWKIRDIEEDEPDGGTIRLMLTEV